MDRSEAGKKGYEKAQRFQEVYEANPKHCLFCGENIPFENRRGKFCNRSCSASFNNRGVTRHIKGSKTCSCGNTKQSQNKYCSECAQKQVYRNKVTVETVKCAKIRRKMLIEQRGWQCEGCGLSEWRSYPIPLEVHHLDGDADNNAENNLQLICANCHALIGSLTGTHKRRNKNGKRQIMRRKRYAHGQTW